MKSFLTSLTFASLLLTGIGCGGSDSTAQPDMEDEAPPTMDTKMSMLNGSDSAVASDAEPETE